MYSRAEKDSFFKIFNTPGPGTYTLPSDRDYRGSSSVVNKYIKYVVIIYFSNLIHFRKLLHLGLFHFAEENVPFRFKVGHTPVWETKPGPAPNLYTIKYRKHRIKVLR